MKGEKSGKQRMRMTNFKYEVATFGRARKRGTVAPKNKKDTEDI